MSRQHSRSLLSGDLASLSLGNINQQVTLTYALSPNTGAHCYPHTDPSMPLLSHSFSHQHTAPLMSLPLRSQVTSWHPPKGPFSACLSALLLNSLHTSCTSLPLSSFPLFFLFPFSSPPLLPPPFLPAFLRVEAREQPQVFLRHCPPCFFETGSLISPRLANSTKMGS